MNSNFWALILGGSSGIGLASALRLAREGYRIFIIHRDRRGSMSDIEAQFNEIRRIAPEFTCLNANALSADTIDQFIEKFRTTHSNPQKKIRLLLHSIALGNLKPLVATENNADPPQILEEEDFRLTIYAMGTSLMDWVQKLHHAKLFSEYSQVIGLTSEGSSVAWPGYAAVSAAKATLESLIRSIAVEFAPYGVRANILQPGVTDTAALRLIPGSEQMKRNAIQRNPYKRLTTPEDIANVVSLMASTDATWINGALIRVDGGEHIAGM